MKWSLTVAVCLLSLHGSEAWATQRHLEEDHENEIPSRKFHHKKAGPPDHNKLVEMARYVMHNCDWVSIATISTQPAISGFPFTNVKSIVDGSMANSTGMPYFYMSPLDFTARDLTKNTRATVLVSLEETRYCESQKWDPEDPRCTRLMLSGKMKKVKEGTPEYTFAKAALFERHPAMAHFPPDHNWFVAKMKIAQIAMVDWFGGAKYVSVKDYLAYNYTGEEVLHYYNRLHL
ncbi:protein CREG1 [Papilio machaon]|uniref:protein CREG1 n=1 Tax=Papilio machaon TaxID=76193 RepID=UPI001E665961|nr:protein CREG1 [Papilio machaon]